MVADHQTWVHWTNITEMKNIVSFINIEKIIIIIIISVLYVVEPWPVKRLSQIILNHEFKLSVINQGGGAESRAVNVHAQKVSSVCACRQACTPTHTKFKRKRCYDYNFTSLLIRDEFPHNTNCNISLKNNIKIYLICSISYYDICLHNFWSVTVNVSFYLTKWLYNYHI